jgi:hypothetical protein
MKMSDVQGYLVAVVGVLLRMTYEILVKRKLHCGRIYSADCLPTISSIPITHVSQLCVLCNSS